MELAKLTSKGQLTIPIAIRQKLGVGMGDQLLFYESNGQIIIAPVTPATLADAQSAAARQYVYTLPEIIRIAVPIAERYQLKKLSLFGSYARSEASPQSDIDFHAVLPDDFGMFRLSSLHTDLEDAFHKEIDIVTDGMLNAPAADGFTQNICEDEVLIYGSNQ